MNVSYKIKVESLPLDAFFLKGLILSNKEYMYHYGLAEVAIRNCPKLNTPLKIRLKLQQTKNEFTETFLLEYLKRKSIYIGLLNSMIKKYFENNYNKIMKQLDDLLWDTPPIPVDPNCLLDKSNPFVFCFCEKCMGK